MNECSEYIEKMYKHPVVTRFINTIEPAHLREDLLQEVALILLEYDCKKLIEIHEQGKLVGFTISIIYKSGRLQKGKFYDVYKKIHTINMIEYNQVFEDIEFPEEEVNLAKDILQNKLTMDANEVHESLIFEKYIELQSCEKVAKYFGVPRLHIYQVVKNVKNELKKKIWK